MEVLVLDGKNYVKASKAARDLGYASDYVGQLCRTRQVDSHLIGRTWYVNKEELGTHRVEKKRMSRAKAREQAKKLIVAHRSGNGTQSTKGAARNIAISYEPDEGPLIPQTRKLEVASERPRYMDAVEGDESPDTVIENKGKKIVLSGDLTVVDVTDGPVGDGTTVLRPKIMRSRSQREETPERKVVRDITPTISESLSVEQGESEPDLPVKITFEDRLRQEDVSDVPVASAVTAIPEAPLVTPAVLQTRENVENSSFFMYLLVQLLILVAVLATLPLRSVLTHDTARVEVFESRWVFSIPDTLTKLLELF